MITHLMPIKIKKENPPHESSASPKSTEASNMCSGCSIHCCKLHVDVTIYDILRITELENKEMDSFVELYEATDEDAFGFKAMEKIVKLSLRKKENGYCTLFDFEKGLHCKIEKSKPGICLLYPMAMENGKIIVREDAICPVENKKRADFSKMNKQVIEDYDWEWRKYYEFVNEWNSSAIGNESPNEFIKYAIDQVKYEMSPLGRFYRKVKKKIFPNKRV